MYDKLKEAGIYANVHYIPVYKHPYYQENGYADVCCKHAEELYAHMISLPLYPDLTDEEQEYVIEQVKKNIVKQLDAYNICNEKGEEFESCILHFRL